MTQFYVYLHCRPDGTPFYVGKGSLRRCREFDRGRNPHHRNVVAKHGADAIKVYMFQCESDREALETEILWIKTLREDGIALVNITDGGQGISGVRRTAETRARISAGKRGFVFSDESRKKMSDAKRGRKVGFAIKLWDGPRPSYDRTPEYRARMSEIKKGHGPKRGFHRTEETKRRISESLIRWNAGRKTSEAAT